MNKLYKYLPFDIQGEYTWEQCDDDGNRECTCTVELLGINTYYEELKVLDCGADVDISYYQFKPILRPFKDLTKELPLTKAAAEMIGMKEGEMVNPLEFMFRYNGKITCCEYINVNAIKHNNGFTIDLNDQTERLKVEVDIELDSSFNFSINHFVWQKKEKYRVANSYYTINLDCLDFLRAMHFAVNFKEDEYIKLED
jgi:hypothetical protein